MRRRDPTELVAAALAGDRAAVARVLSLVERGGDDARTVGRLVYPETGRAYTVGITGSPGAGKSTLTSRLLACARERDVEVGVLAIDPTSPFSGGALLGDRVRMQDHYLDPGVFIRSMATRGHLGGLALATPEAVRVLDAAGFPLIVVETVGVGQVEVDIAAEADTTLVVMNPGAGDAVQAMKAGLLEVADVFVVNKADRPGVKELERDLNHMLDMDQEMGAWRPPIVQAVSSTGEGAAAVYDAITEHRAHLESTGELARRRERRLEDELREIVVRRLEARARELCAGERYEQLQADLLARRTDPWAAADEIVGGLGA
ncbi:MAG TPA: methylmalonyl Co-A mutase-associated GTPase MeaB [Acidimicrobiales bacterium]|jgi:LAO/AO transport system kinase|nr:methylmalonyl Co-A mutase-associated GTPase MeaB [Acidimicrobiales bacterium]